MLNDSISAMEVGEGERLLSESKIHDLKTRLSATITDQKTCLDALQDLNSTLVNDVRNAMENSTEFVSNSLAIATKVLGLLSDLNIPYTGGCSDSKGWTQTFPSDGSLLLLMVGVGLIRFPTCLQEALVLQQDIVEAKEFLKERGVDVNSY